MSTVNYFEARRSNLAAFNTVRLNVSTISGSTIQTSATATTSSVIVSSLQIQSASYSTLSGSSISTSTITTSSLSANALQLQSATYSTLSGSSMSSNVLQTQSGGYSTLSGSSLLATSLQTQSGSYSTLSGSSLSASTLQVQSATYSTLTGSSLVASTISASTIRSNTLILSTMTTSSIMTTGNVGIGTTLPASQLTVHGGNTSTAITVANGYNASIYSRYGLAYSASQYSNLAVAGDTVINAVGGNMILEAQNKNISLSVPNTNSPNTLTVSGTGTGATSSTAGWGSLTNTFKYNNIGLTWTAPVACYVSSISMYLGQGNNGTNIVMYINGNYINEWWPFQGYGLYVINATGSSTANGVATTPTPFSAMSQYLLQPGQTLTIYISSLQTYNYFYYGRDNTTGGVGFSVVYTAPQVNLSLSSATPALSLGLNGVGIGTSSPLAVFDVNGSLRVLSTTYTALTSGTGVDIIYSGGGTLSSGTRGSGGALTAATMAYAASGHTWYVGSSAGTNAMTVASTGRLGVGTAAPRRVVDIVGPPTNPLTYAPTQLSVSDTAGSALMNLLIGVDGTSNYASIQSYQSGVGGRPLLLNATEGNVGIGTSNPGYTLDVVGTGRATSGLIAGNGTTAVALQLLDLPTASWKITTGDFNLSIQNNSSSWTNRLTINQNGFVGIGTTNPGYTLDVVGNARISTGIAIAGTNVINLGYDQTKETNAGKIGYQTFTSGALDIIGAGTANNGTRLVKIWDNLTVSNKLGIGTNTPSYLLHVHNGGSYQTHHLIISGQEFYQPSNSSTGIALNIGVNRAGNKQLWFMDPDLAINTTNAAIRYTLGSTTAYIGAISTDGTTNVPLNISGSSITMNGDETLNGSFTMEAQPAFLKRGGNAGANYFRIAGNEPNNSPYLEFWVSNLRRAYIGYATTTQMDIMSENGAQLMLGTNGTGRIYVDTAGNTDFSSRELRISQLNGNCQIRMKSGNQNLGCMFHVNGDSFYFLATNSGDWTGAWNTLRPLTINLLSGQVNMSNGLHMNSSDMYVLRMLSNNGGRSMVLSDSHEVNYIINNTGSNPISFTPSSWASGGYAVFGRDPSPYTTMPALGIGGGIYNTNFCRAVFLSLAPGLYWGEVILGGSHIYTSCYGTVNLYTNGGGWVYISDKRLKKDIRPLKTHRSLERIMALKPMTYKKVYRPDKSTTPVPQEVIDADHIGFLAQDVMESNPHCVSEWTDDNSKEDGDDGKRLGIAYGDINIHVVGAIQELKRQIDTQEKELAELKALVQQLIAKK